MGVTLNIYIASIATLDGHAVEWNTILLDLYTMDKKINAARGHYHLYLQSSGIVHSVVFQEYAWLVLTTRRTLYADACEERMARHI